MRSGARLLPLLLGAVVFAGAQTRAPFLPVQTENLVRRPAAGRYLVAQQNLRDPNFFETVILLTSYSEKESMGLVVNRPTKVPLSRLFEEMSEAKGRSEPVYLGGPVAVNGVVALMRSRKDPGEGAEHVTEDVYLISSEAILTKAIEDGMGPSDFRVFLGYSGWGAKQLDGELERGSWHVFKADAAVAFDPESDSVWERFIRRTNLQIALLSWFSSIRR